MNAVKYLRKPLFCRAIAVAMALYAHTLALLAQGTLVFATKVGSFDARVTYLDGTPLGPEFTGQLLGKLPEEPIESLKPLLPALRFATGPMSPGYVGGPVVEVPGTEPYMSYDIVLRAYKGESWENSSCRGQSAVTTIQLGGGTRPPTILVGLQGFSVNCIPEPSIIALFVLGGVLFTAHNLKCRGRSG